jgi:hypothetical protein
MRTPDAPLSPVTCGNPVPAAVRGALIVAVAVMVWGFVVAAVAREHDGWPDAAQGRVATARPTTGA